MNFKTQIDVILGGRKITPTLTALGFSNSVIQSMNKGQAPGSDYLQLISRAENANINFLLNAQSAPFLVQDGNPECVINWLDELSPAKPGYIHLVMCEGQCIVGLELFETMQLRTKSVEYRRFDLVRTALSQELLNRLKNETDIRAVELPPALFDHLKNGHMGAFLCLGDTQTGTGVFMQYPQIALDTVQANGAGKRSGQMTDIHLMRSVLELVDETIIDSGEKITANERAKIVASIYNSALKMETSPQALEKGRVVDLLDFLKE